MEQFLDIIKKYSIQPNLYLDQHFMIDKEIIKKIIEFGQIKKTETVLEIGAGLGFLTKEIARHAKKIVAVEIDKELANVIKKETKKLDNIEIIQGNALDLIHKIKFDKIISNTPYLITEALIQKLIYCNFKTAVLTLPKHFFEILNAKEDNSQYSRLSIFFQCFFSIKYLLSIPKEAFYPESGSKDIVIEIKKLTESDYKKNPEKYIIKELFLQKTKKIKNSLMEAIINYNKLSGKAVTKKQAKKIIKGLGLNNKLLEKQIKGIDLNGLKTIIYIANKF